MLTRKGVEGIETYIENYAETTIESYVSKLNLSEYLQNLPNQNLIMEVLKEAA